MDKRPGVFFPIVPVAFCQAPPSMKIPGDWGSKVKLPSVEWGLDVSGTSQCKQKQAITGTFDQKSNRFSVILLPLCPASLTHTCKSPQRHKIICGMLSVGHKDPLIDLKMFL